MKEFILYLICTVTGLVFMKMGQGNMNISLNQGQFTFSMGVKVFIAFVFYMTSFLLWIQIVGKNDLSYIVPMSSTIINVVTICIGVLIFKETIGLKGIFGIVLAVAGVYLMNVK